MTASSEQRAAAQARGRGRALARRLARPPLIAALLGVMALALTACSATSSSGSASSGGHIQILVPTTVGGGTDTTARFIAKQIQPELPGHSSIQVVDTGDATFIPGMNQFANSDADGKHWLMTSGSGHLPYIFNDKALKLDLAKQAPILATTVGNVILVRTGSGIKNVRDLVKSPQVVYGGGGAIDSDTTQLLGLYILGAKIKPIFGLKTGPRHIALEQKEIDLLYDTTPAYLANGKDLVDRGVAKVLYTAGQLKGDKVVRDPAFPNVPSIEEVYEQLHGKPPSGPAWDAYKGLLATTTTFSKVLWLHGTAPADTIAAVRNAAVKMTSVDGFYKQAQSELGPYKMVVGANVADTIQRAFHIEPATIAWLTRWLKQQYDVVPGQ